MQAGENIDSIGICAQIMEEIYEKGAEQVLDAFLLKMRPSFVKKQLIQQALEACMHGNYRADKHELLLEDDE